MCGETMTKTKEGSYTIECALIFPIVLAVITAFVWLVIYAYDRVAIEKNLIHGLLAADYDYSESNSKLQQIIEDRINENMNDEIIGIKEMKITVSVGKNTCRASAEGIMNIPEGIPLFSKFREINVEIEKKRYSPVKIIDDIGRIKEIYTYISTTEESDEGGNQTGNEQAISDFGGEIIGLPDSNGN